MRWFLQRRGVTISVNVNVRGAGYSNLRTMSSLPSFWRSTGVTSSQKIGPTSTRHAWVLNSPVVSAPIVGATKPHHLPEAIEALNLHLTVDEIRSLEEPYTPHGPSWF